VVTKISVPRRRDASGVMQDVRVPDHVDILATFGGGAVAHLRFSSVTALAPPPEAWLFGTEGTLRLEANARRLSGGRRGDKALSEIAIPDDLRIGWRVEEEFVSAIRGTETITRTTFEDGVRYMEFTDAVAKSAASGHSVEVAAL
jgi:predicted dehydrogenase